MNDEGKDFDEMTKEERKEYLEELGAVPRASEEHETGETVSVVEEEEGEEERKEEEYEAYRERTGF